MLLKKNIRNSIEFSNRKGFFILKTSIEDLEFINNKYGLNNAPATYIVLGDTVDASRKEIKFYVGESSSSVMNRLNESIKKRPWIKEIFIIISPQGLLTMEVVKSLEYMIYMSLNNSLKDAVPGDLSLVFPYRIMKDIEEMIYALDEVTPGMASDETLLYGVEVKFYSNKILTNKDFETNIKGLRAIGDGASVTRGLQQASANGLSVAKSILNK